MNDFLWASLSQKGILRGIFSYIYFRVLFDSFQYILMRSLPSWYNIILMLLASTETLMRSPVFSIIIIITIIIMILQYYTDAFTVP